MPLVALAAAMVVGAEPVKTGAVGTVPTVAAGQALVPDGKAAVTRAAKYVAL